MNKYGYKICYKRQGKNKLKIYLVTNAYRSAEWSVRWYESRPPLDRKTLKLLDRVTWLIIPIKTFIEYKRLWRGCPF